MEETETRTCEWTVAEWDSFLEKQATPVEQFRLISKLSGAGVVVRVLETPESEASWFGLQDGEGCWRLAQRLESVNVSPYQPILRIQIDPNELGTSVELHWAPHPDANMLALAEWVGASLCVIAGLVGMQENPLALVAIIFGVLLLLLPRLRAKWSFQRELRRGQAAFADLEIPWEING